MVHLMFNKSDAFFIIGWFLHQLNQNIETDCSSIVHIEYMFCMSKIDWTILCTYALTNQWCAQSVFNMYIQWTNNLLFYFGWIDKDNELLSLQVTCYWLTKTSDILVMLSLLCVVFLLLLPILEQDNQQL